MHPEVLALLSTQHGLVTRAQLLDRGVGPAGIESLVRHGRLTRVRRGVLADREAWDAADSAHEQPVLRARAALLMMRREWVLSHDSAAHTWGLDMLRPQESFVHVTRPGFTNAWTKAGVKHHLARFAREQVQQVDGLRVLDVARTVADLSREHGFRIGLVAADAAMRRGVRRAELEAALEPMRCWPGVTTARAVAAAADAGAETPAETLAREFVLELGIPLDVGEPETQFPVRLADGSVRRCDIRVGCHVFEVHGRIKYVAEEDGGVAARPTSLVLFDERKRERHIADRGLGITNLYWDDFWGARRAEASRRALADWHDTLARYGRTLPPALAADAERLRRLVRRPSA